MALPSAVKRKQGQVAAYGVIVLLVPTTTTADLGLYDVEVQRAPDTAGAPDVGNAETIDRIPPISRTGTAYTDRLPNDNTRRHYRWRHVRVGFAAGAYSSWLITGGVQGAKPGLLDAAPIDASALNRDQPFANDLGYALRAGDAVGKEAYDDVWVLAAKTVKVGTAASPTTITKTRRIAYAEFVPAGNATKWNFGTTYLDPNDITGGSHSFVGAVVLPKGVTITQMDVYGYQTSNDANHACDAVLYRDGTSIASVSHGAAGYATLTASFTETTGNNAYSIVVTLQENDVFGARLVWVELTYTMPSYDKGI